MGSLRRAFLLGAGLLVTGCGTSPILSPPPSLQILDAPAPREILYSGIYENYLGAPYAPLVRPSGVAILPDGGFALADYGSGRVHIFSGYGDYQFEADQPGAGELAPLDLSAHGFLLYALDYNARQVLRYDEGGVLRDVYLDLDQLSPAVGSIVPSAFSVDSDGRIAVCDVEGHRVLVTSPFLRLETVVGEYGTFAGQFQEPRGVTFAPGGLLYVSDRGNRRVQVFDRTGQPLGSTLGVESKDALMVAPSGMATDRFGNVYVTDTGLGVVHVLAPDLFPLAQIGGDEFDDDWLSRPVDCAISGDDRLYIVDAGRNAVLVYDLVFP